MLQLVGSFRCSIALFAVLCVTVALGMLIESPHPSVYLLLGALFLNLSIAIIRKRLFKVQQLPLLMLHLGSMAAIAGLFIDSLLGFHGIMILSKHQSKTCILPSTYAIAIESENDPVFIPISEKIFKAAQSEMPITLFSNNGIQAKLVRYLPHAKQRIKCFADDQMTLFLPGKQGVPVILQPTRKIHLTPMQFNEQPWKVTAIKSEEVGETAAELSLSQRKEPSRVFALIEDQRGEEYVLMIGQEGGVVMSSVESLIKNSVVAFNNGRAGYGIRAKIPQEIGGSGIDRSVYIKILPSPEAVSKKDSQNPCLYVNFNDSEIVPLTYDPTATSFRWPILGGKYLARFQPLVQPLPHTLRHKRWECPHSPLFDHNEKCRCVLTLAEEGVEPHEIAIGYRKAYVAKRGGYRYVLMNTPSQDEEIHIGVQHFIAKFWLIYPGIFCAALGLLCLYLRRKSISLR